MHECRNAPAPPSCVRSDAQTKGMTKVVSALVEHRSDPGDPSRRPATDPGGPEPDGVDDATRFTPAAQDRGGDAGPGADAYGADGYGYGTDDAYGYGTDEYGDNGYGSGDGYDPADAEQETSYAPVGQQRAEFGRHLEAHYPRLVAQLYAITLDAGQAHDLVQEAYARAWRKWGELVGRGDPADWVRRVAVSTSMRSWSALVGRVARRRRPPEIETMAPRAASLVGALHRISPAERRAVVLHHMVGMPVQEIAEIEHRPARRIEARLTRARLAVTEDMGDVFLDILGAHAGETP